LKTHSVLPPTVVDNDVKPYVKKVEAKKIEGAMKIIEEISQRTPAPKKKQSRIVTYTQSPIKEAQEASFESKRDLCLDTSKLGDET
jgi:hypothetical protein